MIKIYCEVCGKEYNLRSGYSDYCKKCEKKIDNYIKYLKNTKKRRKAN